MNESEVRGAKRWGGRAKAEDIAYCLEVRSE